jgi:DNA polymerase I
MLTKNSDKKLFLLDAYALIYRAYFAFSKNPRINSKGMNTSAIFGFVNTLLDVLQKENPTHIAVVFDPPSPPKRAENFEAYKANREETPEDIKRSVPYIMKIIEGFKIPILMEDGYEADDVVGTIAKKAEKEGFTTYMMTPDKDFGQLVSENIFMFKPSRMGNGAEVWGVNEVLEKFEIKNPLQVIDILGLWGDAVDNIPGVPGVGEKTAKKLIGEFGSMEKLFENLDSQKGKLKENLENFKEQAFVSKMLATIMLDAPVAFEPEKLILESPDPEIILPLFEELEFRRLSERIFNTQASSSSASKKTAASNGNEAQFSLFDSIAGVEIDSTFKTIENTPHQYHLVNTPELAQKLLNELEASNSFCFDTETTSVDSHIAELVGIAFAFKPGEAYYLPLPSNKEDVLKALNPFLFALTDSNKEKIGHNIKYDINVLRNYTIQVEGPLFDTMVAHYLLESDNNRRSMDILAETYLNYRPVPISDLIGPKGKNQKSMRAVDPAIVAEYAGEDADITLQLKAYFEKELAKGREINIFNDIEMPLIYVLSAMEVEGVNLDTDMLKSYSKELATEIILFEKQIHETAGQSFNIASPKQVGEVLFDKLKIVEKPKKTKTGQYATNEEVLLSLEGKHPIVNQILNYRELVKLKSTYVDSLPSLVHPETKHLHTSFNQVVASTGRLSSDNPNLQNIPIRTEKGRYIRKAFIPRNADYSFVSADYSQVELRIIAALSKDEAMLDAFKKGLDIHASTAARVFGVPLEEVSREMRSKAKTVNFGIIYGISAFGLSQRINISRGEAKEIIDSYFEKFPGIKTYMDEQIAFAKEKGYVETITGRKRYLRDINSANAVVRGFAERNAINSPIQGSAADIIKLAMINIHKALKEEKLKSKMILQVHDELIFDVFNPEKEQLLQIVKHHMTHAMDIGVPLDVDAGFGKNWFEAH